ncbi:MAG TPA: hypothetical protein VK530_12495 [Candidatus Acidoferrum sp.]|nr:hypothetical protein [Candidatus Acidoferrum sp.]
MIRLRSDCLEFELSNGEKIPCSAQTVTVELMGSAMNDVDQHVVENAAAAVLHYFREDLKKESVTLSEFTAALEVALRGLGLNVCCDPPESAPHATHSDLRLLAAESGKFFELGFFNRLRNELRENLGKSPTMLRFSGLRSCVKQLAGARRWSPRCQKLNDHIVDYLRGCVMREKLEAPCDLVVS